MDSKHGSASPASGASLPLQVIDHRLPEVTPSQGIAVRYKLLASAALVLLVLTLSSGWMGLRGPRESHGAAAGSDRQPPVAPPLVFALGRLAPQGDLRTLAAPYGAGDARIAQLFVDEGQQVTINTPLAVFDSAPALEASIAVVEQQLSSRRAELARVERVVTSSQAEAAAALARARVAARAADLEYQRWTTLVDQGFVSASATEQRKAQRDEAAEEFNRANAALARHAGEGAAQPDLLVARHAVDTSQAELDRAKRDLAKSVLRAPSDGTIIRIKARPGERPGTEGVFDFGDTRVMTAELEVYQADVTRVVRGQHVTLHSPALFEPLHGRIGLVGISVGRQRLTDASPAANTDARVVRVVAVLNEVSAAAARSLVGLEVRAEIDTRQTKP